MRYQPIKIKMVLGQLRVENPIGFSAWQDIQTENNNIIEHCYCYLIHKKLVYVVDKK